jgi:hypothetical protein
VIGDKAFDSDVLDAALADCGVQMIAVPVLKEGLT